MSSGSKLTSQSLALLVAFLVTPQSFAWAFAPLTQYGAPPIYNQGNLIDITLNHLWITFLATVASTIIAVGLAIIRQSGANTVEAAHKVHAELAKVKFPKGFDAKKPYLRVTPQPDKAAGV